jgi:ABC-type transport system involved in cytochrome bd biosynthesis fused ATPase/permease subunit
MRKTGVMMLLSHQIVALRRATTIYRLVMNAPAIELVDIHKSFGSTRVLEGVSLSLLPGEVHSLMGENGAGKSTPVKIMAGHGRNFGMRNADCGIEDWEMEMFVARGDFVFPHSTIFGASQSACLIPNSAILISRSAIPQS